MSRVVTKKNQIHPTLMEARSLEDGQISTVELYPIYRWKRNQNVPDSNLQSLKKLIHISRFSMNQICRISTASATRSQS